MIAACAVAGPAFGEPKTCGENAYFCTDVADPIGYGGEYTGHDEPSVLFYSNTPGSGNSNLYRIVLPKEPFQRPTQDGLGATRNFESHITFWFGMDMCDTESAPEYQNTTCTPDSDANIFDSPDPAAPDYIGHHPGGAFMELQFYPPGWTAWEPGVSCDAVQWCAALTIESLNESQVDNTTQNQQCLKKVSDMHDTPVGFQVVIHDLTTGETGSMTASVANGFRHVLYEPHSSCHSAPYAYHPMYATSSEHTRLTWTAHGYNVAFSDEIGHFEYCDVVIQGKCKSGGATEPTADGDDVGCFSALESLLVQVSGCLGTDTDFDGVSYQPASWPGTNSTRPVPDPILFSSPLFNGTSNYSRVAFETDSPRIEAADLGGISATARPARTA